MVENIVVYKHLRLKKVRHGNIPRIFWDFNSSIPTKRAVVCDFYYTYDIFGKERSMFDEIWSFNGIDKRCYIWVWYTKLSDNAQGGIATLFGKGVNDETLIFLLQHGIISVKWIK